MRITMRCLLVCWAVGALGIAAYGVEYTLTPISASGSYTIVDNTIVLDHPDQVVTLEIRVDDWHSSAETGLGICNNGVDECDLADPDCPGGGACYENNGLVAGWQATIDSSGYEGVLGPSLPDCTVHADCQIYGNPYATCNIGLGVCDASACAFIDSSRDDYIFHGMSELPAVSTATLNYSYLSALMSGSVAYENEDKYCGTLVLKVPDGTAGSFTVNFIDSLLLTKMNDTANYVIVPLEVVPVVIAIACEDDQDCTDGDECTEDVCNPDGTCSNPPNYDTGMVCSVSGAFCLEDEDCPTGQTCITSPTPETALCCDPDTGDLTLIDDGNECTKDECDPDTGEVTHPFEDEGEPCGSQANTICHDPDACDGAGTCIENFEPPTTVCREATSDCDLAEYCTGSDFECPMNQFKPPGDPCGSPVDEECNDPDTCDGAGTCLDNHWANGADCDDELYCNVGEICTDGACGGGTARDCSDDIPCTTDACNEDLDQCDNDLDPGYCLIEGVCYLQDDPNPDNDCQECDTATPLEWSNLPADSPCEDGNPCTYPDLCDGDGNCIPGPVDPNCNDTCTDAIEALEGITTSNNVSAGPDDDAEASCQPDSNHDIWFRYTAACNGDVFMSTTGSLLEPSNDPVLSVYDNCDDLNEIACDDDSGLDLQASLIFAGVIGTEYRIRVAGFEDNVGDVVLNVYTVNDCVIDGTCYAEGTVNPANDCEECNPELSTLDWSPRMEGTPCGNPYEDDCNDGDACDGDGNCETNFKPDGTACTDDGNDCTDDLCETGVCDHPNWPPGTPCGDPNDDECDNPDTCNGAGTCLDNYEALGVPCGDQSSDQCDDPNICDGQGECDANYKPDGWPCDDEDICTGDDICDGAGGCAGTAIAQAPVVEHVGCKRIQVTPLPAGSPGPVALHLTSPNWTCLSKYIQADGSLADTPPVFQLIDDWATITVLDENIVPDSVYVVVAECGIHTSDAGSDKTSLWGDHNEDDIVGIDDIMCVVLAFQGEPLPECPAEVVDISPCTPDGVVGIDDLLEPLLVYQHGRTYADTGCPLPCP